MRLPKTKEAIMTKKSKVTKTKGKRPVRAVLTVTI
jgi:hypothetical protein